MTSWAKRQYERKRLNQVLLTRKGGKHMNEKQRLIDKIVKRMEKQEW